MTGKEDGLEISSSMPHPNRVWFQGILTFLDSPSDAPPTGADNHRVLIPGAVAAEALHTLIGMPVNFDPSFYKHNIRHKCGLVTGAAIIGHRLVIKGFFYAYDYPEVVKRLRSAKANKEVFGFSFDATDAHFADKLSSIWEANFITFTGATLILAANAAYRQTRIELTEEK